MKATEQYFPVIMFIMLYKMVLTFESVIGEKKLKCYNSNRFGESYWAVLSYVFGLLRCTKWFLLLSLWMTSRSATSTFPVKNSYM